MRKFLNFFLDLTVQCLQILLRIISWHVSNESVLIQVQRLQHSLTLPGHVFAVVKNQYSILVVSFSCHSMEGLHGHPFR